MARQKVRDWRRGLAFRPMRDGQNQAPAAPTVERNTSKTDMAILKPCPGCPIMADGGNSISLNLRRASGCGATTSMRSAISSPLVSAGAKKAESPFAPGASPVRAKTTYTSAMPPFEIQVFSPVMT